MVFIEVDEIITSFDNSSDRLIKDLIGGVMVYFGLPSLSKTNFDPNTLLRNFFSDFIGLVSEKVVLLKGKLC